MSQIAGKELNFHRGTPLTAGAHCNRLLWSAAQLSCDLYFGQPTSALVGDKLYENTQVSAKAGTIIEELKARVEFPDVRELVNQGELDLNNILKIREKAVKFRKWLQQESERDRDAIIAYHNEVAKEVGFIRGARKVLSLFGVIGGGAAGSVIGNAVAGPAGGILAGAAGSGLTHLLNLTAKLGADWKPVVFGNWLKGRISDYVRKLTNEK